MGNCCAAAKSPRKSNLEKKAPPIAKLDVNANLMLHKQFSKEQRK